MKCLGLDVCQLVLLLVAFLLQLSLSFDFLTFFNGSLRLQRKTDGTEQLFGFKRIHRSCVTSLKSMP